MASRVIGFRVPVDIAEELEKVSSERGMTITEFLRSLVDETLYPGSKLNDKGIDDNTREKLESLTDAQQELTEDMETLSTLVNKLEVKISGYEISGILSPKTVEIIQGMGKIKEKMGELEYKGNTLSTQLKSTQDDITLINKHGKSLEHSNTKLAKEVEALRSQLGENTSLLADVEQLKSEVTRIKREIKRQPTDEIHTLAYKDGSEHKFRVYKSKDGLVKPHKVGWDPISGDPYVDLNEPLD